MGDAGLRAIRDPNGGRARETGVGWKESPRGWAHPVMAFVFSILVLGGLLQTTHLLWERLREEDNTCPTRAWLLKWAAQGAIAPVCFWMILNSGFWPSFPPLLPEIAFAQAGGGRWGEVFLEATGPGILVIGTFWSALTLAWLLTAIAPRAVSRSDFFGVGLIWAALSMLVAIPIVHAFGLAGLGGALTVWELKYAVDADAARALFQRLVREFPHTPQAFTAQRRLKLLEMEEKLRQSRKTLAPAKRML